MNTKLVLRHALLLIGCFLVVSCAAKQVLPLPPAVLNDDEPPGVGEKAERGYAACKPIIEALETYKEANGSYPADLEDLVPETIAPVPSEFKDGEIWYEKTDTGYILNFTYLGPGMNICKYSPEAGEWKCSGAY